eukprot:3603479-Prymnesium_polylepis.1
MYAAASASRHEPVHTCSGAAKAPMPRSNRAQSSTTRAHGRTTVSVCMIRIIEAYMKVHRVHG